MTTTYTSQFDFPLSPCDKKQSGGDFFNDLTKKLKTAIYGAKKDVKKPATKKPATKKPATKKPATKKPATKKPATKKPATKKPATKKPATKKQITRAKTPVKPKKIVS